MDWEFNHHDSDHVFCSPRDTEIVIRIILMKICLQPGFSAFGGRGRQTLLGYAVGSFGKRPMPWWQNGPTHGSGRNLHAEVVDG